MKHILLIIAATFAFRAIAFVSGLLIRPEYGDPSLMPPKDVSYGFDAAAQGTAFVPYDGVTEVTAIRWFKKIPRAEETPEILYPCVLASCTYEAARATREGGAGLQNIMDDQYLINPLPLTNGCWQASILPHVYDLPPSLTNSYWKYGCYTVNYTSDCGFDLVVGGASRYCAATNNASFNIIATNSDRTVSIAARSPDASISFGIAENPIRQFIGSQWSCYSNGYSQDVNTNRGGIVSTEWRMVAFRAKIENERLVCGTIGYNATQTLDGFDTITTNTMWKPRASFQKDARICFNIGMMSGLVNATNSTDKTGVIGYGFKVYGKWLDDAALERIRDLDRAEMTRRGYVN